MLKGTFSDASSLPQIPSRPFQGKKSEKPPLIYQRASQRPERKGRERVARRQAARLAHASPRLATRGALPGRLLQAALRGSKPPARVPFPSRPLAPAAPVRRPRVPKTGGTKPPSASLAAQIATAFTDSTLTDETARTHARARSSARPAPANDANDDDDDASLSLHRATPGSID
jgi:hypothetical protein